MKIFNTLTRKKEEFIPVNENKVLIYTCGPTVYNYIHIGNARPICVFDVLRRYLMYRGYDVKFVQNYTDIDDKIIKKATEENTDYSDVARKYIEEYQKDAQGLNVLAADVHPKATENINEMIDFIDELIKKGYAYVSENKDVYFRTLDFDEYGKLSHQPLEQLEAGARIKVGEQKENPMDFALWKAAKPTEPYWQAPWGKGRPGWHIECSAMAKKYLADTIDIHCGGQDLIFPHHENEIAQSECCNDKEFAKYWMHNGYINIDNKKMSKSLNNFFTVRDISNEYGYEPIRYLMICSHYRSPINFSQDLMAQCTASLERLYNCKENLEFLSENAKSDTRACDKTNLNSLYSYRNKFIKAMDDDLNTADAIAVIFDVVKEINHIINNNETSSKAYAKEALKFFTELTGVLGLLYVKKEGKFSEEEIDELVNQRTLARKEKNWAKADEIREKLKSMGVVIEDTPSGVKWHYN